jgi:hypothetical protein
LDFPEQFFDFDDLPATAQKIMTEVIYPQDDGESIVVDLRDPYWAAFLAWMWPGAGHFYQRRWAKGYLFMICILSTFFYGLFIGRGRVVYASFKSDDFRWQYVCQLGAGVPALPAIAQAMKTQDGADPFFVLCERHTQNSATPYEIVNEARPAIGKTFKDGFMAPPAGPISQQNNDVLGQWHFEMKHLFEIGTLFTVVAGLLNMLAIYDAFCGPAILTPAQKEKMEAKRKKKKRKSEA